MELDNNWIFVMKDTLRNKGGITIIFSDNEEIYKTKTRINAELNYPNYQHLIGHEQGHSFTSPSHPESLPAPLTIMRLGSHSVKNPGLADCEAGYLLYDETYKPGEPLENILKETFNDYTIENSRIINNLN